MAKCSKSVRLTKYPRTLSKIKSQCLIWGAALLGLTGCGYTLNHRLKEAFTGPRGIYVPVFDNQTDEVGAERVFTDSIRRELQSRGEMVLASREDGAMELRGIVRSIDYYPTAFTQPGFNGLEWYRRLPTEIAVTATVSLALLNPQTGAVLWSQDFIDFRRVEAPTDRTYDFQAPSSVPLMTQSLIEARYADIAGDISRDFYDAAVELF